MAGYLTYSKIYKKIVELLEFSRFERRDIISRIVSNSGLSAEECENCTLGSAQNNLRARIGSVLNDMESRELISIDSDGLYYLVSSRPVTVRIEKCEREILRALTERPMAKGEIRERLQHVFGTDKTASTRDDDTLFTFMGRILKKLEGMNIITLSNGIYSLSPRASARADDINEMLALRSDFITHIHIRGGEFFENYFMTLLSKYSERHGKKILECYVTGGSADGGIDGVMKTEDSLGFREVTMVQTKNRTDIVSETDVRGFYGAVCAKRGTRGIFASTSDFHSGAEEFLASLDDCVGINGDRLFRMAIECSYGIKKNGEKYVLDIKII